jgi:hypothetical protein
LPLASVPQPTTVTAWFMPAAVHDESMSVPLR